MAAYAARNPSDRGVFDYHWYTILRDPDTMVRTIDQDGEVAGAIICHLADGVPELSFWTARPFWGQGITTAAVDAFLAEYPHRPITARVPADNIGSQKVLTRRGFAVTGEEKSFSNALAEVVTELLMELR